MLDLVHILVLFDSEAVAGVNVPLSLTVTISNNIPVIILNLTDSSNTDFASSGSLHRGRTVYGGSEAPDVVPVDSEGGEDVGLVQKIFFDSSRPQ